jgi:hypothetical protein
MTDHIRATSLVVPWHERAMSMTCTAPASTFSVVAVLLGFLCSITFAHSY